MWGVGIQLKFKRDFLPIVALVLGMFSSSLVAQPIQDRYLPKENLKSGGLPGVYLILATDPGAAELLTNKKDFLLFYFTANQLHVYHECSQFDLPYGKMACLVLAPPISLQQFRDLIQKINIKVDKMLEGDIISDIRNGFSNAGEARELADINLLFKRAWGIRLLLPSEQVSVVLRSSDGYIIPLRNVDDKDLRKIRMTPELKKMMAKQLQALD